jgi:hypothetical protein
MSALDQTGEISSRRQRTLQGIPGFRDVAFFPGLAQLGSIALLLAIHVEHQRQAAAAGDQSVWRVFDLPPC